MRNNELEISVEKFLETKNIIHSDVWKNEMIKKLESLCSEFPDQHIRFIYDKMLIQLSTDAKKYISKRYPGYYFERIEDIVHAALEKWLKNFNGKSGLEWNYLLRCLISSQADEFKEKNPKISEDSRKTYGLKNISKDENESVKKLETIAKLISDEEIIDNLRSDFSTDDLINRKEHIEDLEKFEKEMEYLRKTIDTYDKPESSMQSKKIKASQILLNYYYMLKKVSTNGLFNIPKYYPTFFPSKLFMESNNRFVKPYKLFEISKFFLNRLEYFRESKSRECMEITISELRKCKDAFDHEISIGRFNESDRKDIPLLGAVVIDKNGCIINKCFKGQIKSYNEKNELRTFEKHCEYSLFKEIITNIEDKNRLIGGTLYVTLEPCNKRGVGKIPCAVLCIESGIAKIFIGSSDTNPSVEKKGVQILESGEYSFHLRNSKHVGTQKEIKGALYLEEHFRNKKYNLINDSPEIRTYRIGPRVEIKYFPPDLMEEVCKINGHFLHYHKPEAFEKK